MESRIQEWGKSARGEGRPKCSEMKPNAVAQPRRGAVAKRRLLGVGCNSVLGKVKWHLKLAMILIAFRLPEYPDRIQTSQGGL